MFVTLIIRDLIFINSIIVIIIIIIIIIISSSSSSSLPWTRCCDLVTWFGISHGSSTTTAFSGGFLEDLFDRQVNQVVSVYVCFDWTYFVNLSYDNLSSDVAIDYVLQIIQGRVQWKWDGSSTRLCAWRSSIIRMFCRWLEWRSTSTICRSSFCRSCVTETCCRISATNLMWAVFATIHV